MTFPGSREVYGGAAAYGCLATGREMSSASSSRAEHRLVSDERRPNRFTGWASTGLLVLIGLLLGAAGYTLLERRGDGREPEPSAVAFRAPGRAFDQSMASDRVSTPAGPAVEPTSARAALQSFLAAETSGDASSAFPLLDQRARDRFSSVEAWAIGRNDRIVPLTFAITGESAEGSTTTLVVDTTHEPALDAFRGYVPAKARQRWTVQQEDGKWRVAARPLDIEPLLPAAAGATEVVQRWVDARAACDTASAEALQRSSFLYGSRSLIEAPCADRGTWSTGAVQRLADVPDSTVVTSTFGPDSGVWARVVPVRGPRTGFLAVVAALGDDWRVVALIPGDAERN